MIFGKGRHENRINSLSFRTLKTEPWLETQPEPSRDTAREEGYAVPLPWWRKQSFMLIALSAAVAVFVGGLLFWYHGRALAAERVLEPDRMMTAAPEPKPLDPLLEDGENIRSPSSYRGKTTTLEVGETDIYRGFLVLVNDSHILPDYYLPENLAIVNDMATNADVDGLSVTKPGMELNETAAEMLLVMVGSAQKESEVGGWLLQSAYRDFTYQNYLHQRKVEEYRSMGFGDEEARRSAAFWVARPRESEHHTGLAMDLSSRTHPDLQLTYANTVNGRWLAENCRRFGFIIRYPEEKSDLTKVGFEPWHIRYVGFPHSEFIPLKGWCFEEYLEFLRKEGGYTYRDEAGAVWQVDYQVLNGSAIEAPADLLYTVSGDGEGGFIVTTLLEGPVDNTTGEELLLIAGKRLSD